MQAPLRLIRGGQIHLPISLSTFEIEILVPSEGKKEKKRKNVKTTKNQKQHMYCSTFTGKYMKD